MELKLLSKRIYALQLCRWYCENILKPKHEIPKPQSIQNILLKQEHTPLSLEENGNPLAILQVAATSLATLAADVAPPHWALFDRPSIGC